MSPASGTARAALDTTQGHLILDSIQGGGLGGSGLTVQYGEYSAGGTDIGFDLTKFAGQYIQVQLQFLAAGDTKGPQPGITWRTNIHSRDLIETTPGNFQLVEHFTNVDVPISNSAIPLTASLPVSALLGGPANATDLVGMQFKFLPLGTGAASSSAVSRSCPSPLLFGWRLRAWCRRRQFANDAPDRQMHAAARGPRHGRSPA